MPRGVESLICTSASEHSSCSKFSNLTIVNRPLDFAQFVFDDKNKLDSMLLNFSENYYEEVKEALITKYGKPTSIETIPLSNKLTGTQSVFEKLHWEHENGDSIGIQNNEKDGASYKPMGMMVMYSLHYSDSEDKPADI